MSDTASDGVPASREPVLPSPPAERRQLHTRLLRCMLAADDCYAYWRNVDPKVPLALRAGVAFEQRWFGVKSEARVRTLVGDMFERFDAYPEALAFLRKAVGMPSGLRLLVCHLHVALADPAYRRFVGHLIPDRRAEGRTTIDRPTVARWVDSLAPDRWSPVTRMKFASNLLATARDVGIVRGTRDPRELPPFTAPDFALGYALYVLRGVRIEGTLADNPYLRSLGVGPESLARKAARIPGVRVGELGSAVAVTLLEPDLAVWGLRLLSEAM